MPKCRKRLAVAARDRNVTETVKLTRMPRYFFHLIGDIPAHDFLGHECESDDETRDHASFLVHRIGTESPKW